MQSAIGYIRVSTREQGRSGLGLAAQRREIESFGARCPLMVSRLDRLSRNVHFITGLMGCRSVPRSQEQRR